jgi:hypothetical protein
MSRSHGLVYKPLSAGEFRLVTLHPDDDAGMISCTLHHASLDSNPEFEALLYVWGSEDIYNSILIDGGKFGVRRNLWFALFSSEG